MNIIKDKFQITIDYKNIDDTFFNDIKKIESRYALVIENIPESAIKNFQKKFRLKTGRIFTTEINK